MGQGEIAGTPLFPGPAGLGQLSLEARPILTGVSPDLCLLVIPPPELPLTLWLPRTTRLGGAPTDDSGESSGLSP